MVFEKLFPRKDIIEEEDMGDYVEVNVAEDMSPVAQPTPDLGKIGIKIEKLSEFNDTDKVLKSVREGHIIFLRIKSLKEKDMGELKRSIERLKKTVMAQNGEIIGIEQDWLIIAPAHALVHK